MSFIMSEGVSTLAVVRTNIPPLTTHGLHVDTAHSLAHISSGAPPTDDTPPVPLITAYLLAPPAALHPGHLRPHQHLHAAAARLLLRPARELAARLRASATTQPCSQARETCSRCGGSRAPCRLWSNAARSGGVSANRRVGVHSPRARAAGHALRYHAAAAEGCQSGTDHRHRLHTTHCLFGGPDAAQPAGLHRPLVSASGPPAPTPSPSPPPPSPPPSPPPPRRRPGQMATKVRNVFDPSLGYAAGATLAASFSRREWLPCNARVAKNISHQATVWRGNQLYR